MTITDRLSRFSKLGGEMVPHVRVEEAIFEAVAREEFGCVVAGVKDERKGEKLVVLCSAEIEVGEVVKKLSESGLPNLWIPKQDSFYQIEEIPKLSSGKLDLKSVKEMAVKLSGSPAS